MNAPSEADEASIMAETLLKIRSDSMAKKNDGAVLSSLLHQPKSSDNSLLSPPRQIRNSTLDTWTSFSSPAAANVAISPSVGSRCSPRGTSSSSSTSIGSPVLFVVSPPSERAKTISPELGRSESARKSPFLSMSSTGSISSMDASANTTMQCNVTNQALKNIHHAAMIQQAALATASAAPLSAATSNNLSFLQFLTNATVGSNDMRGLASPQAASVQIGGSVRPPHTPSSSSVHRVSDAVLSSLPSSSPSDKHVVRKEEVERALKSKPQRGRKRSNLSQEERLFLTRTRNREHAKSTRMRKKARHHELVESEKQLKELLERQELDQKRRECALEFLDVRARMLQSAVSSHCNSDANSSNDVAFHDDSSEVPSKKGLEDLVEDLFTFTFQDNTYEDAGASTAVDRMKQFDETLATCVAHKFEEPAGMAISYKLQGSSEDIAVSRNGTVVLEIQMVLENSKAGTTSQVLPAVLKLGFAPNSDKLLSGKFGTLGDSLRGWLSFNQLEGQVSHPSVVSLDEDRDRREAVGGN